VRKKNVLATEKKTAQLCLNKKTTHNVAISLKQNCKSTKAHMGCYMSVADNW